jgi:hypothetical protein
MKSRLLNKTEAAAYLGVSTPIFARICPVRPLCFGERLFKFDVVDLDRWVEAQKGGPTPKGADAWLEEFDREARPR